MDERIRVAPNKYVGCYANINSTIEISEVRGMSIGNIGCVLARVPGRGVTLSRSGSPAAGTAKGRAQNRRIDVTIDATYYDGSSTLGDREFKRVFGL